MIRKSIHQWLSAAYGLPVVEDIEQTAVEKAISYDLAGQNIQIQIKSDDLVKFSFDVSVQFRCPNGFAGIGFLTLGLANPDNQPAGFNLHSTSGTETVEYETKTEMIISKPVSGYVELEYNMIRELIECVHFTEGLNCYDCEKNDFNQLDFNQLDFA